MPVIDLDEPESTPDRPPRPGRLRQARTAVLLAAVVTAGAATYFALHNRSEAAVKLLIFNSATDRPNDDPTHFTRQITVVNVGRDQIDVRQVTVHNAALSATSVEADRWVQPGKTVPINLDVTMSCQNPTTSPALTAAVIVKSAHNTTQTVAVHKGAWITQLQAALATCQKQNS